MPKPYVAFMGASACMSDPSRYEYTDSAFGSTSTPSWDMTLTDASAQRTPNLFAELARSRTFNNPDAWGYLVEAYALDEYASHRCDVRRREPSGRSGGGGGGAAMDAAEEDEEESWFYDTLRDKQNRTWADERLARGVLHAKEGRQDDAFKCYEQALGMCPRHVDVLVARGALLANRGDLRRASADLQKVRVGDLSRTRHAPDPSGPLRPHTRARAHTRTCDHHHVFHHFARRPWRSTRRRRTRVSSWQQCARSRDCPSDT